MTICRTRHTKSDIVSEQLISEMLVAELFSLLFLVTGVSALLKMSFCVFVAFCLDLFHL